MATILYGLKPDALVGVYLERVFPKLSAILGPVSHASPLPVVEIVEIAGGLAFLGGLGWRVARLARKKEKPRQALARAGASLLVLVSALYLFFVPCGLYVVARRPVEDRLLLDPHKLAAEDLVRAACLLNEPIAAARVAIGPAPGLATTSARDWLLHGSTDALPVDPAAVESAARAAATDAVMRLESRTFTAFIPARWPVPDTLLHRFGVTGSTLPLFSEVLMSPYVGATEYAASLPHELVHAAGVIREREADFYAFVGAARSPDPFLRYAVLTETRGRLLHAAVAAGIGDAWERARPTLPESVLNELDRTAIVSAQGAFAPGGSIETNPGQPDSVHITGGEEKGAAPVSVYRAVTNSAGLPTDYASAVPLMALWILERGL